MNEILYYFLLVYFTIFFGIVFLVRSVIIKFRIGKSPIVFPNDDSVPAMIGHYMRILILMIFVYLLSCLGIPLFRNYVASTIFFQLNWITNLGLILLGFALTWTIIAQYQMKDSWRIGIDQEGETELIITGLFGYSRNQVFLGMLISLLGLICIMPNVFTIFFYLFGTMLVQIQIRLEEEHLTKIFQERYVAYRQNVRRFL